MRNLLLGLAATTLFAGLSAPAAHADENPLSFQPNIPCKVIYLANQTAATDLLYQSTVASGFTAYTPLPAMPSVDNGWGIYATTKEIYAGESPNHINIYPACSNHLIRSLTTVGSGPPVGIAVDRSGNAYATEYFSNVIDWFNPAGVDTPSTHDTPRAPGLPFYIAVDSNGFVYTSGWNHNNSVQQIDVCHPHMTVCAVCEMIPAPSWPGGLAVDAYNHLIVNNEYGSIRVFAAGCGAQLSAHNYSPVSSPTHYSFTGLALDTSENAIWALKEFHTAGLGCTSPYCMDAQAIHYTAAGGILGPLAPAAHTPIIQGDRPGSGIAVWPPGPI